MVALATPWCLVGIVGLIGRVPDDQWDTPGYGPAHTEQFDAYCLPMNALNAAMIRQNPEDFRRTAQAWVDARRGGNLVDVPRHGLSDTTRNGIRAEILNGTRQLSGALYELGQNALVTGDRKQAAKDFLLAIELAQFQKMNDLAAFHAQSNRELTVWNELVPHFVALDGPSRNRVLALMSPKKAQRDWESVSRTELAMLMNHQSKEQRLKAAQIFETIRETAQVDAQPVRAIGYYGLGHADLTVLSLMRVSATKLAERRTVVPEVGLVAHADVR